jgi:valyl-tRNA synthetase
VDRDVPIVADDAIDAAFGTGAVKVTPAHDPTDFEIGKRHGLMSIDVMTPEARMAATVPEEFQGLDRFEARKRVVQRFEELGLLEKVEDHAHAVGHCYRCHTIVEPRLSEQWFVKMAPLAKPALQAYRDGRLRFIPEHRGDEYAQWMENIRDWCISRQLWWGHRIPVWYCDACGKTHVSRADLVTCQCGAPLRQDEDVLDTWFSSWLVPFSSLGWPERTRDLAAFYPGTVLVTAPEILFFWVARMVMAGCEFMGDIPFSTVYLHGTVRDTQHRKMSKSLGNGIDPLGVVQQYGADALRYTLVAGMSVGTDVILDPNNIEGTFAAGRNFANKLWNAGRFILTNLDGPTRPLAGGTERAARRRADARRPLDHRALRRHRARGHRGVRAVPPQRRRGGRLSLPVERPRRLVHRAHQAAALRRHAGRARRACRGPEDVRRGAPAAAPDHAVRDRGAVAAHSRQGLGHLAAHGKLAPSRRPGIGARRAADVRAGAGTRRSRARHPCGVRRAARQGGARGGPAPGRRGSRGVP